MENQAMSPDKLELMDLPEHILLKIMGYLGHDTLGNVISKVSTKCRLLARSKVLWSEAHLDLDTFLILEIPTLFVRKLIASPYLHCLTLTLQDFCDERKKFFLSEELRQQILTVLLSTRCKVHKVRLMVEEYRPELEKFLWRHLELRELELKDKAAEDDRSSSMAASVGHVAHHLISLNLNDSSLPFLPRAGKFLSRDYGVNPGPNASTPNSPDSRSALDLSDDIWNHDRWLEDLEKAEGLQHLEFIPPEHKVRIITDAGSAWDIAAHNLSKMIRVHKRSLKTVKLTVTSRSVWMALGTCSRLEDLLVLCDEDGSGFRTMLRNMPPTLRRLDLRLPGQLGAEGLARVLQTLCRFAPRLESLTLSGLSAFYPKQQSLFPGFGVLQPLLMGTEEPGTLRELYLCNICPVGGPQLQELASMANFKLSLNKLDLRNCKCSEDFVNDQCRNRGISTLKAAMPSLELTAKYEPAFLCPNFRMTGSMLPSPDRCRMCRETLRNVAKTALESCQAGLDYRDAAREREDAYSEHMEKRRKSAEASQQYGVVAAKAGEAARKYKEVFCVSNAAERQWTKTACQVIRLVYTPTLRHVLATRKSAIAARKNYVSTQKSVATADNFVVPSLKCYAAKAAYASTEKAYKAASEAHQAAEQAGRVAQEAYQVAYKARQVAAEGRQNFEKALQAAETAWAFSRAAERGHQRAIEALLTEELGDMEWLHNNICFYEPVFSTFPFFPVRNFQK
ncbi:uncharacterized protein LOC117649448 [Thrips palmi]|uniref:Uncharacterized protein LOC117649448 n=1 Tax=Thrips palmi TaxID=161013 RepID=A0A6P8ZSY6_THRPL|nr:uncharacterized protein LOC117649448 [Thrips palmi]XP_034248151.1 uncharacterized protein LOC117649448 [Thrips palmi]